MTKESLIFDKGEGMNQYGFAIGDTYQRGQQERTIVDLLDSIIYYQNKTDKKLGLKHGVSYNDFILWVSKATKKGGYGEFVVPPTELSVAQRRKTYLARSRDYFKYFFEKQHKDFSFESFAYHGLHWADWEYVVRLVCHSFGVSTVDKIEESRLEEANDLACDIVTFIFKANIDTLKAKERRNDES